MSCTCDCSSFLLAYNIRIRRSGVKGVCYQLCIVRTFHNGKFNHCCSRCRRTHIFYRNIGQMLFHKSHINSKLFIHYRNTNTLSLSYYEFSFYVFYLVVYYFNSIYCHDIFYKCEIHCKLCILANKNDLNAYIQLCLAPHVGLMVVFQPQTDCMNYKYHTHIFDMNNMENLNQQVYLTSIYHNLSYWPYI